jgi:hypothetical protein
VSVVEREEPVLENVPLLREKAPRPTLREVVRQSAKVTNPKAWAAMYWVPPEMGPWLYRVYLSLLDPVGLKALDSLGAVSSAEATEWINLGRARLIPTHHKTTGIHFISEATFRDWLEFAKRRELVVPWSDPELDSGSVGPRRWALAERGRAELRSPLHKFFSSGFGAPAVGFLGGSLVGGAVSSLSHSRFLSVTLALAAFAIYCAALAVWDRYNLMKQGPGSAVVAIETIRCAGEPLPSLVEEASAGEVSTHADSGDAPGRIQSSGEDRL